jgi:hypothetical protein
MNPLEPRAQRDHPAQCVHEQVEAARPEGAHSMTIPNWIIAIATLLGSAAALITALRG